jgi:polar amino acid transport system substrate-binding protein
MLPRGLSRYLVVFAVLALASALAFAACDDDDEDGGDGAPTGAVDISGVPELEDGVLQVGSDIAYAPFEFFQEGTEIEDGLDIDLAKAIASALGVEVEFINTGFDGIIPALQTEDFDVIISAMTITDERSEEIGFVAYITVGTGIVVPTGNPDNIQTLDDLCGLTVAVQVGTIQVDMLEAQNETCADPIDITVFDTNPLAVEDLRTGGSDANFSDFPVSAEDAAQSEGDLEVVETQIAPEPYGIGVRKDSTTLSDVITQAIQAIRDSGEYDQILADWDLEAVALQ